MTIIDTHCHLYAEAFGADLVEVIHRAQKVGVKKFFLPNLDRSSIESMLRLEESYSSQCYAMMGLHPCSVKADFLEELRVVESWLKKRKFAAVGEIGLDFYWDRTFEAEQYEAFRQQIEWAIEYDLPIVIHSRDAMQSSIDVVADYKNSRLKGIFHCFGGTPKEAEQIISLGFYLGIGGVLTFKKSGLKEVLRSIDLEHIVLETDAPYLAPVPMRGKRNESAFLQYIISDLAEIKGVSEEEVARITTTNASLIYRFGNHF